MAQPPAASPEPEREDATTPGLLEFEEQTEVGGLYLQALMRRQLRLSLTLAAVFCVFLVAQPLLGYLWRPWGTLKLLGIPVAWLVLGVGSYPLMIWLGSHYVSRAEELDDEFTDLLR